MALPDFVIIGAMKCATSTLAAQLAAQPGIFVTDPKEPNFFSDDTVFARGRDWYEGLFAAAPPGALKGEASTHYTKLPTHPQACPRMAALLEAPRLVYVIRDPLERLVSHYLHGVSLGEIRGGLDSALARHPELVEYGRYAMQLAPWLERYGAERICLSSLERIEADPEGELARIARFIGHDGPVAWAGEHARENASAERVRRFPGYALLVESRTGTALRRALVPSGLRRAIRARLSMRERPALAEAERARLIEVFTADRAELARLLPGAPDLSASYPWAGEAGEVVS